ncbi:MAG: GGDEF domain-containing protein [Actinomycetota bacterium]
MRTSASGALAHVNPSSDGAPQRSPSTIPEGVHGVLRLEEIDRAIIDVVFLTAIGAAALGLGTSMTYGGWYAAAASGPFVWILLRRWFLDRLIGVPAAVAGMVAITTWAMTISSVASGGLGGPGPYFAGLVAMLASTLYPDVVWVRAIGVLSVAVIVATDLLIDRPVDWFHAAGASILALAIPTAAERLVRLESEQRRRSIVDPLTGCLNRRSLRTRIDELDAQVVGPGVPMSVIVFDIDHFKNVNDRFGHGIGDHVLVHVAKIVREQLRRVESLYRTGGEEFLVLLPETDLDDATVVAVGLRAALAAEPFAGPHGPIDVTASFGVAGAVTPVAVGSLSADADRQLYRAKEGGRNCVARADHPNVIAPRRPTIV